jgi:hypothetical protein
MMFRPQNNATDLQIDSPHCSCCCFWVIVRCGGVVSRGDSSNPRR